MNQIGTTLGLIHPRGKWGEGRVRGNAVKALESKFVRRMGPLSRPRDGAGRDDGPNLRFFRIEYT